MENKDCKEIEKLSGGNPKVPQPGRVKEDQLVDPYGDQNRGIVRIEKRPNESEQEFHTLQEHHNANHALYYFSMITDGIIRGRTTGDDSEKIRRIKEHMMTLREFISEDKAELRTVINSLLERLEKSSPIQRKQFAKFIYKNWSLILSFAEAYGHHERCFPKAKYQKLRDIVLGTCYLKLWWWELRLGKLVKSSRHFIKSVFTKYVAREDKSELLFKAFFNNKMTVAIHILTFPQIKREPIVVERTINSIDDIFHHFCPQDSRLVGLFEELIALLKKYPGITEEDSQRGIGIAEELLKVFDSRLTPDRKKGENNG